MTAKHCGRVAIYLAVFAPYLVLFLDDHNFWRLTREDGPIESLGALLFLATAILFAIAWHITSRSARHAPPRTDIRGRSLCYLGLMALFIVCCGEEISWGQRIFDWEAPPLMKELNSQGETNVHNIWFVNGRTPGHPDHTVVLGVRLNMNSVFSVFALGFCVIIPVLARRPGRAQALLDRTGIPIAPFWLGALFLSHAILFHILYNMLPHAVPERLDELRETNYAFMFVVLACRENVVLRRTINVATPPRATTS